MKQHIAALVGQCPKWEYNILAHIFLYYLRVICTYHITWERPPMKKVTKLHSTKMYPFLVFDGRRQLITQFFFGYTLSREESEWKAIFLRLSHKISFPPRGSFNTKWVCYQTAYVKQSTNKKRSTNGKKVMEHTFCHFMRKRLLSREVNFGIQTDADLK